MNYRHKDVTGLPQPLDQRYAMKKTTAPHVNCAYNLKCDNINNKKE